MERERECERRGKKETTKERARVIKRNTHIEREKRGRGEREKETEESEKGEREGVSEGQCACVRKIETERSHHVFNSLSLVCIENMGTCLPHFKMQAHLYTEDETAQDTNTHTLQAMQEPLL